jgi:hypothetical protein
MLFTSSKESKVVSSENGFIHFKNGRYETDNRDEIEALKKCGDVFVEEVEKPKKETKSK